MYTAGCIYTLPEIKSMYWKVLPSPPPIPEMSTSDIWWIFKYEKGTNVVETDESGKLREK
jgi:hypothetical protein